MYILTYTPLLTFVLFCFSWLGQVEPRNLRNIYYVGLAAYYTHGYDKAAMHFHQAITTDPKDLVVVGGSEADVQEFYIQECLRGLELLAKSKST